MDYAEKVFECAGKPAVTFENPSSDDWHALEADVKWKFPYEIKGILSKIGSGNFGLDFYLLNPKGNGITELSLKNFLDYCSKARPLLSRVNLYMLPNKNGGIRIGHISTRLDLFLIPVDKIWKLQIADYNRETVIDLDMGVAEFLYKMYKGKLPISNAEELRDLVWGDPEVQFFSPHPSTPIPSAITPTEKRNDEMYDLSMSLEERLKRLQDTVNNYKVAE